MLSQNIVDEFLHIARSSMLTLATCHDIPRSIISFIHEILGWEDVRVVDLTGLDHSLICTVRHSAVSPFLTHIKVILVLLLRRPVSTFKPFNGIETDNTVNIL